MKKLSDEMLEWLSVCSEVQNDITATLSSVASLKSKLVNFSGASLPRLSWKRGHLLCLSVCLSEVTYLLCIAVHFMDYT